MAVIRASLLLMIVLGCASYTYSSCITVLHIITVITPTPTNGECLTQTEKATIFVQL